MDALRGHGPFVAKRNTLYIAVRHGLTKANLDTEFFQGLPSVSRQTLMKRRKKARATEFVNSTLKIGRGPARLANPLGACPRNHHGLRRESPALG